MGSRSVYLVLFQSNGAPAPDEILVAVARPGVEVVQRPGADSANGKSHLAARDTLFGTMAEVYLSDGDYVLQESWEIAAEFAADRRDREYIAGCDRRFEVLVERDDQMLYFTNWLITTERLQTLVGGVVFDPGTGTFPDEVYLGS